ncbi:unnamed protein product [Caenorhabditis sp. 36 PRJEB53466]|nr:unnamed protein product [Caenorhabditis sp. 36 PRJEB53466]
MNSNVLRTGHNCCGQDVTVAFESENISSDPRIWLQHARRLPLKNNWPTMEKAVFMEIAALHEPNGLFPNPERLAQSRQAFANIHNNWPGRCDESPLQMAVLELDLIKCVLKEEKNGSLSGDDVEISESSQATRSSTKMWCSKKLGDYKTASQLLRESIRQAQLRSDIVCHQLANFELQTLETLGMNALLEYKLDETEENREEDPRVPRTTLKHIDKYKIQMAEVLDAALYQTSRWLRSSPASLNSDSWTFRARSSIFQGFYGVTNMEEEMTCKEFRKVMRIAFAFNRKVTFLAAMEQIGSGYKNINLAIEDEFSTNRHGRACICMHSRKFTEQLERPMWQGFVLAFTMFGSADLSSILLTSQTMHGVAVMVLLFPINFVITMIIRKWQLSQIVKELGLIKKAAFLRTFSDMLNTASPFLVALSTFTTSICIYPINVLTLEIVFASLTLFNQLCSQMSQVAEFITQTVQVVVSNRRLKEFLKSEQLKEDAIDRKGRDNNDIIAVNDSTLS